MRVKVLPSVFHTFLGANLIHWLEGHQQTCHFKKITGLDCPGCGMQRAIIALLKGNIWESIMLYPALIPIILMFVYLILHLFLSFKNGGTILKYMFIINTSIIMVHFVFKIIFH